MGKKFIISGADFSANAIPIARSVAGTTSPQYVYVANTPTPSSGFDWNSHKVSVTINEDGSITNFNLPSNTVALPKFFTGADSTNGWLEEIDLSYLSETPLTTFRTILAGCTSLKKVVIGGTFPSLTGANATYYMFSGCNNPALDVEIDKSFNAPNMESVKTMFYNSEIRSLKGLNYLLGPSITDMSSMFSTCKNLEEIDLSGCNTENVTTFELMFYLNISLKRIVGLNELNTGKVSNYERSFGGVGNIGELDISQWNILENANTKQMFYSAKIYELNANCFTALYGNISGMFYMGRWNTIHLDNLNDVSAVTDSSSLFSSYVSGVPKVTIANVTNSAVKTFLINALNTVSAGGSSNWHESTVDGVLCLVP